MPLALARNEARKSASQLELVRLATDGLPATTAIVAEARTTPGSPIVDPEIPTEKKSAETSSSERAVTQATHFLTDDVDGRRLLENDSIRQ